MQSKRSCCRRIEGKMLLKGNERSTQSRGTRVRKDQSARNASPFRMPLEFISLLVIAPLRKRFVNSLTKFLNERCEHIDDAVGGPEQDLAISMDFEEFLKKYTKFCYRFDLHEITSLSAVQTHLREKHNIAIHTKMLTESPVCDGSRSVSRTRCNHCNGQR